MVVVVAALSQATLIFSGPLEGWLPMGMGAALFAAGMVAAVLAFGSSLKGMIGMPQAVPLAVLGMIAAGISANMAEASRPEIAITVLAGMGVATFCGGLGLWLLGFFRLGSLIRFIPFPVIAAFLAGSGWFLAQGSVELIAGESFAALANPQVQLKLFMALGFVAILSFLSQRTHASLALSLAVLAASLAFHGVVYVMDFSHWRLIADGWLMAAPQQSSLWPPFGAYGFALINWPAIWAEWPNLLTLPALAALGLLMNSGGLELALRRDIELDRELQVAGLGNVVAGLGGGNMGYQDLGLTLLSHRVGGGARISGIMVALVCFGVLAIGGPVAGLVPKPLFGGLLMWIGANLLLDWAVLTQSQLRKRDYALLLGVLVVMMTAGPLIGIGVGFAAALILFAVDYARTDIVRARLDGTCFRSSVERSASGRAQLAELGGQIVVYRLQGFLFFATAARLREEIEERLAAGGPGSMRYLLLDFAAVTGFDSSTVMTMVRFERMALAHDFTLVFTGLKPESLEALERGGLTYGEGEPCHVIAELDRGMEYCEDRLLQAGPKPNSASLVEELSEFIGSEEKAKAFAAILEPIEFEPGDVIVARDDQADDIYFFESGRARVMPDGNDVSARRLRSFGPGSILGELAFFTGQPRQATVCATRPVKAWRLTRASLDALEKKDQNLARDFYRALSEQFAHRLSGLNRMMQYLVD